jgi:hypothetical protein
MSIAASAVHVSICPWRTTRIAVQTDGVSMNDTHNAAEAKGPMPFKQRYSATIDDSVEGTGSRIYDLIKDEKVKIVKNGRRPLVLVSSLLAALEVGIPTTMAARARADKPGSEASE